MKKLAIIFILLLFIPFFAYGGGGNSYYYAGETVSGSSCDLTYYCDETSTDGTHTMGQGVDGRFKAGKFTTTGSGTVCQVDVWILDVGNGITTDGVCYIYDDDGTGNKPETNGHLAGGVTGKNLSIGSTVTPGWVSITGLSTSVDASTTYWVMVGKDTADASNYAKVYYKNSCDEDGNGVPDDYAVNNDSTGTPPDAEWTEGIAGYGYAIKVYIQ